MWDVLLCMILYLCHTLEILGDGFLEMDGHWWSCLMWGSARGHQGASGGSGAPPAPKRVIKQQNNGPKPWIKVPKVCPDPKGMVPNHF